MLRIINDPVEENTFNTLFVSSGKSINDLGNYEKCQGYKDTKYKKPLKYSLVTVTSSDYQSLIVQMGLCIPVICNQTDLEMFNKMYM